MEIVIDFAPFYAAANQGLLYLMWFLFIKGGWVVFAIFFLYAAYRFWLINQSVKYANKQSYVILAIDIPKDTEQTPKAVEQLFSTVSGAHSPLNLREMYIEGKFQLDFSFEIVSIDGYIQFLIRTPVQFRDLIESSIYSQYPDAEITEVEDYVDTVPDKYPNETHNIWGAEIIMAANDVLPIRTYMYFEDSVSGEFKDPLSSLLETMSKIKVGEQVWFQILVEPTDTSWIKRSLKEAYKLAGKKMGDSKPSLLDQILGPLAGLFFLSTGDNMFFPTDTEGSKKNSRDEDDSLSLMIHLTPGEREKLEAIEKKASKTGFNCKMRLVYISPLELYSTPRVVSSVFGSIKQFNTLNLNAFKPDPKTKTQINYFMVKRRVNWRRQSIINAYKSRSGSIGHASFILNTEELATLWHFPSREIRAPMLQRTESKKAEPPFTLPRQAMVDTEKQGVREELVKQLGASAVSSQKPEKNTMPNFDVDLDNKYFEKQFAKKDTKTTTAPIHRGSPPPNLPTA